MFSNTAVQTRLCSHPAGLLQDTLTVMCAGVWIQVIFEPRRSPPCWQSHVAEFELNEVKKPRSSSPPTFSDCFCSSQLFSLKLFFVLISLIFNELKVFVFLQNSIYIQLHIPLSLYEIRYIIDQKLLRLLNLVSDEFCFRRAHCSQPSHRLWQLW